MSPGRSPETRRGWNDSMDYKSILPGMMIERNPKGFSQKLNNKQSRASYLPSILGLSEVTNIELYRSEPYMY